MVSLINIVLVLRLGIMSASPAPVLVSVRNEPLLSVRQQPAAAIGHVAAGTWVRHGDKEWVPAGGGRLNVGELAVNQAAAWIAAMPVQVDVGGGGVSMRVTVRTP